MRRRVYETRCGAVNRARGLNPFLGYEPLGSQACLKRRAPRLARVLRRGARLRPGPRLPGYDPRTDFRRFLMEKSRAFEAAVLRLLRNRCEIVPIGESAQDSRDPDKARATLEAMKAGVEVIHCAVLHDGSTRTYGMPDLLVRGDVLERLFPGVYALELERQSDEEGCAPDAPARLVAPAWAAHTTTA